MSREIETMAQIQEERTKKIAAEGQPPLDPEGIALTENKRESFDMPINVAKVDPLR